MFTSASTWPGRSSVKRKVAAHTGLRGVGNINGPVVASCHLSRTRAIDRSSRAGYRSILVLTLLANMHAGLSERRVPPAPIKTPEWSSRLSGQRRILFTQPRDATQHECQLVIPLRRQYFPLYISRLIYPSLATVPF